MLFGEYRFTVVFQDRARLPRFKGSTLRGALGIALKRASCALRRQECASCLLAERCVYCRIFETVRSGDDKPGRGAPHPFALVPPMTTRTDFAPEEQLRFSLLLFGDAVRDLPYLIYAVEQMGRKGLGRKISGKRGYSHNKARSLSGLFGDFRADTLFLGLGIRYLSLDG